MRIGTGIFIGLLCLAGLGCAQRLGSLTLMSTKNLPLTPKPLAQKVQGEDCVHQVLFIPIGSLNPNLQDAIDKAIAQVPGGNAMTDLSIHEDILFLEIYNRICLRVDGNVVAFEAPGGAH